MLNKSGGIVGGHQRMKEGKTPFAALKATGG